MMSCPVCAHENPDGVRFCVKCGWQLVRDTGSVTTGLSPAPVPDASADALHPNEAPPTSRLQTNADTQEFTPQDFLVLVVDDTVDNLVIISLHLQQSGYRVVTATDGEEAIKVAALTHPDLILMDISMPGLDGLGAARRIREHPTLRPVPIIAVTAFTTEGFQRAAYDAGMEGYLTKPIDFERLNDLIRSLLPVKKTDLADTLSDEDEINKK
ncbi:MAG TPA: response regulator [Pyrinomonadaceae bacterium]|nr:response regulator [Pyrinomonadaceae bacterium]